MKIYTTDNNQWVSSVTGKPFALTHQQELDWQDQTKRDPNAIPNPNYGQVTVTGQDDPPTINTAFGQAEYQAAVRRQAAALSKKGQVNQALYLLKSKGL